MGDTPYRTAGAPGPIIIETPQPDLEERLIVVDEATFAALLAALPGPLPVPRDATPADLERAGWVRDSDLLALTVRAEAAEAERDEARDTIARARGCITDVPAGVRNALDIEVARLLRERDEARREAAKLDAKLAQAEERGDLADQRAIDAIAERDEVRRQRDAEIASRDALARVLEQVERERDEARCLYEAAHCERMRITDVLQRVERERDEARAALATMTRQRDDATALASRLRCDLDRATDREDGLAAERARCVASVRAHADRIRALPADARWAEQRQAIAHHLDTEADALERGEHADTPVPAAEPRATDEDLGRIVRDAWVAWAHEQPSPKPGWLVPWDEMPEGPDKDVDRRIGAAVAARVRAEREPRDMPRATDEELVGLFDAAASRRAAVAAVAARVRREQPAHAELDAAWAAAQVPVRGLTTLADVITTLRERPAVCLVTRAVEANVDIRVCEDDGGGFMVGVHAPGDDEDLERNVPAADVPATLARLLGEVARG